MRPRIVGAVRLSRYNDSSTSPEIQTEMIQAAGSRIGGDFVGWPTDLDISAIKTTPWERPKLRSWLDRPDDWDVMIWQRLDRAVRSMADMAALGGYAKEHGKRLVFASGPGGDLFELDFTSSMSELIVLILAFAAQLEGQTITERTQGTAAHLQSMGRFSGGIVPYGYQPTRKTFPDGNAGWWLAEHPETADVRRQMVHRAIAGATYNAITDWLNESEALNPTNHRARLAGRPEDPSRRWMATAVRSMLLSPVVRGYVVKRDGTVIRDPSGAPVLQGEPLIDDGTWHALQAALKERERPDLQAPRRKDAHPLLGVLICGTCERRMQTGQRKLSTGDSEPRFQCSGVAHTKGQPAPTVPRDATLKWVHEAWLAEMGVFPRIDIVRVGGVDYRNEVAELEGEIERLTGRLAQMDGAAGDIIAREIQVRSVRAAELAAIPVQPSRKEYQESEQTWAEAWDAAASDEERRQMLLMTGTRVRVGPPTGWRRPVGERLRMDVWETRGKNVAQEELEAIWREAETPDDMGPLNA